MVGTEMRRLHRLAPFRCLIAVLPYQTDTIHAFRGPRRWAAVPRWRGIGLGGRGWAGRAGGGYGVGAVRHSAVREITPSRYRDSAWNQREEAGARLGAMRDRGVLDPAGGQTRPGSAPEMRRSWHPAPLSRAIR